MQPDILVDGLGFYRDSSIYLSVFFLSSATLRARWTELNQTGHMLGSKFDLKMHLKNVGIALSLQIGGPKTTFFDNFTT